MLVSDRMAAIIQFADIAKSEGCRYIQYLILRCLEVANSWFGKVFYMAQI